MSDDLGRFILDSKILGGKAVIKGTRIPVHLILNLLASGISEDDVLNEYPKLKREDIRASLAYASKILRELEVFPLEYWNLNFRTLWAHSVPSPDLSFSYVKICKIGSQEIYFFSDCTLELVSGAKFNLRTLIVKYGAEDLAIVLRTRLETFSCTVFELFHDESRQISRA